MPSFALADMVPQSDTLYDVSTPILPESDPIIYQNKLVSARGGVKVHRTPRLNIYLAENKKNQLSKILSVDDILRDVLNSNLEH